MPARGRLTEAGGRRPGTWTSAPWGVAAAACCRVLRVEEVCAAGQSWRQMAQRVGGAKQWAELGSTSEETQPWSGSWGCFFGGIGGGVPGVSARPASPSLSSEE